MVAETYLIFGDSVKALDDSGKVGGYLVRFSTQADPDISDMADFFTANTDFDMPDGVKSSAVYYNHGLDPTLKRRKIGSAQMKADDVGIWAEAQLNMRDDYEKMVYQLAKDGKLGWSSGTAQHLIEREEKANGSHEVKAWPLGLDASLTVQPAEPRNKAITSLKSWAIENDLLQEDGSQTSRTLEDQTKSVITEIEDFSKRLEGLKTLRESQGRTLSDNAITHLTATTTAVKNLLDVLEGLRTVPVTEAETDRSNEVLERAWETLLSSYEVA